MSEPSTTIPLQTPSLLHEPNSHTLTLSSCPTPIRAPTQHLLSVHTTALCAGELLWAEIATHNPSSIPGFDVAGTILTSASGSSFKPGDEVYGLTSFSRPGNARGVTVAESKELARAPKNRSWEERASVPLSALTAWQALFLHGGLAIPGEKEKNSGKRVLVTAAAGGVGAWAVQLAKLAGAEVVGTCGTGNVEFVKRLGADDVVDYRRTGLREWVKGGKERKVDVVVDCVGGKTLEEAWVCGAEGGIIISVVMPAEKVRPREGLLREYGQLGLSWSRMESSWGRLLD
ncbi:hypothetical protein H2199_007409 [Coniosporium tulheliwenetii]|uniref:Uncharacterized protein n=1 Tax=Coniosporium tulheliwenetii TaxID=3383036 RepID=A0ACC2YP24_9PEZI|nr:hypothetical protein H2199_007409 [Cladosporium sp. JES 115]